MDRPLRAEVACLGGNWADRVLELRKDPAPAKSKPQKPPSLGFRKNSGEGGYRNLFGSEIEIADINNDGTNDVLISAVRAGQNHSGAVWVYSGASHSLLLKLKEFPPIFLAIL
ncbi:MAG: FG-GAP repeat protein [Planctomycetes bacterium]|nr:FG-GAP repeat protein [Planctomycetota bacterium]